MTQNYTVQSVLALSEVTPMTEVIDAEKITCSPAKKKMKLDTERIIMGEELTDQFSTIAEGAIPSLKKDSSQRYHKTKT